MSIGVTHGRLTDLAARMEGPHAHESLGTINDHELKIAVNEVPYRWHCHPNSDELLLVTEGELSVEFENSEILTLRPLEFVLIPAGTVHKTSPTGRAVNLVFERRETDTEFLDPAGSDEGEE